MSMTTQHSALDIAEAIELDLWNDHRYQITATVDFYVVLQRNLDKEGSKVGDEAGLSSALVHTRSLLEFYRPALTRQHSDTIWWATALGHAPADNRAWQQAIGKDWARLQPWVQPMHTYLAHLSWGRRSLVLPKPLDKNGQRWPLADFTAGSLRLLDKLVSFVRASSSSDASVIAALEQVQSQANDLWRDRRAWAAKEVGVRL